MKRWLFWCLLMGLTLPAQGTTLLYQNFDDLVSQAEGIVFGTVYDVESLYDQHQVIYTFVTLGDLEVLKGTYEGRTLVVRIRGGVIGEEVQQVVGAPWFHPQDRTLVFLQGNGQYMVPFVGWTQGVFQVWVDETTGDSVIHDYEGNPVWGLAGGHLQKASAYAPEARILETPQGNSVRAEEGSPLSQWRSPAPATPPQGFPGVPDDGVEGSLIIDNLKLKARRAPPPAMLLERFTQAIGQRLAVEQVANGDPAATGEPKGALPQRLHSVSIQEFRQFGTPGSAVHQDMPPPGQPAPAGSKAVTPKEGSGPFLPQPIELPSQREEP